jgi:signal transduction histidine kinase
MVELYQYVAEDKGIVVSTECSEDFHLTADYIRMRQVIANLLDNAIKYNRVGGRVIISGRIEGPQAVLRFRDTGIGIPAEEVPMIWDRLYRGDKSRSQPGLGLGLSVVKAIVLAHRGDVEVSSEPGIGSEFIIRLPVS